MERLTIAAPSSFEAGKTVYVSVTVFNDANIVSGFWTTLKGDGTALLDNFAYYAGLGTKKYDVDFIMPAKDVLLIAEAWLYTGDEEYPFLLYAHVEKTISVTTLPPPLEGISGFGIASFSKV